MYQLSCQCRMIHSFFCLSNLPLLVTLVSSAAVLAQLFEARCVARTHLTMSAARFHRGCFQTPLRRVEISSWHSLGSARQSIFLRGLANDLLAASAPGLVVSSWSHRFTADRFYWLGKPDIPGEFDAGLATVRRIEGPHSARLVLAMFEPRGRDPLLLYAVDRICTDAAGRPATPEGPLETGVRSHYRWLREVPAALLMRGPPARASCIPSRSVAPSANHRQLAVIPLRA
ncbi:unnamed protein product [Prorocentrum cordatum]|uniref:Uncharacterized protein n=1 Tax=Prorocentrum cordatum TaxID=2364126 RepID=A0ABN9UQI3_9DINO|nr:unnamed protein product [Polarella glacialis]